MTESNFDVLKLVRKNVSRMMPYSSARDEFKDFNSEMIYLDANENPNDNGVNRYPDPQQFELKRMLSKLKNVNVDQILLGNGSDEVLDLIFRAFCEPNHDNVIILPPTYGMYQVLADVNAVATNKVFLSKDFQPNVDEVLKSANENTKLLFICSPNNPTGNIFDIDKIEEILQKFQGLVVIDEAYIDFSNEMSWISKLNNYQNLIVTQTLSKAYGMAGIRLGICYASKEIISILNKIKPPYNVNELTQKRAIDRLKKQKLVQSEVDEILNVKDELIKSLKKIGFVEHIYPSDANFILVKVDNANQRYNQLINNGIVVRNRSNQPLCENCLRFTIGTTEENKNLIESLSNLEIS